MKKESLNTNFVKIIDEIEESNNKARVEIYNGKPIHTHLTSYYLIERPLLWFAKDEKITHEKISLFFTPKAIRDLIEYEFIKIKRP